jgi:hypothetical protein
VLPAARTRDEAHLYMDLHGCPRCGSVDAEWAETLIDRDGMPARRYHAACGVCGEPRDFVFALPERATPPEPGAAVTFGAAGSTSELFDAGDWVAVADMMALAAGLPEASAGAVRESLAIAVSCLDEALNFLPGDAAELPPSAFWTDGGRAFRERAPGRFRRADLEQRRADLAARR